MSTPISIGSVVQFRGYTCSMPLAQKSENLHSPNFLRVIDSRQTPTESPLY